MIDKHSSPLDGTRLASAFGWVLLAAIVMQGSYVFAQAPVHTGHPVASKPESAESLSKKVKSIVKAREAAGPLRDTEIVRDEAGLETMPKINGGRDPFRAVEPPPLVRADARPQGPLPPGAAGLLIRDLKLEGVVREEATQTMIAVVTNATNIAYFLREHDQVYDGSVSRITSNAVYFTENYHDAEGGAPRFREVVMRLGPISGEGR